MRADIDAREVKPSTKERRPTLCGVEVPKAGHICAFFDSTTEKHATVAAFLREALSGGDRVIDVMEASSRDEHVRGLLDAGIDVDAAIEDGQLTLSTCEETYFRDGRLDPEAVLDMLDATLRAARAEGRSVRTCGEMNWIARDPSLSRRAMEYEARVNQFLPTFECTLMCVYDLADMPATLITDILATHPYAILNGQLHVNPWAVEPKDYIAMLESRPPTWQVRGARA